MNANKTLFSLLLCLLLILVFAQAAQPAESSPDSGKTVSLLNASGSPAWELKGGTLTISGTGAMEDYNASSPAPWYSQRSSIQNVVINNGVTYLGDTAFCGCTNLTSVEIPASVTKIGYYTFQDCSNLSHVSFASGSQLTNIGVGAFQACKKLESVTIPDTVKSIGSGAFQDCPCLTGNGTCGESVNWHLFANGQLFITGTGEMEGYPSDESPWYSNRADIRSAVIGSGVTTIGSCVFDHCTNLTSVTLPDSVTAIKSYAFHRCDSLAYVTIPAGVTSIDESAFSVCNSLTSISVAAENKNVSIQYLHIAVEMSSYLW